LFSVKPSLHSAAAAAAVSFPHQHRLDDVRAVALHMRLWDVEIGQLGRAAVPLVHWHAAAQALLNQPLFVQPLKHALLGEHL
jgi:hypothetical protein